MGAGLEATPSPGFQGGRCCGSGGASEPQEFLLYDQPGGVHLPGLWVSCPKLWGMCPLSSICTATLPSAVTFVRLPAGS